MDKVEYAFRKAMKQRFPLFGKRPHVPLMIGVKEELLKVLAPESKEQERFIMRFLSVWVRSPKYLTSLVSGGPRYDLELNPVGEVKEEQRRYAAVQFLFKYEERLKKAEKNPEYEVPPIPEVMKEFEDAFQQAKKNRKPQLTKAQKAAKHAALLAKQKADKEARLAAIKAAKKAVKAAEKEALKAKQQAEKKADEALSQPKAKEPKPMPQATKPKARTNPTVVVKKRRRVVVPS